MINYFSLPFISRLEADLQQSRSRDLGKNHVDKNTRMTCAMKLASKDRSSGIVLDRTLEGKI